MYYSLASENDKPNQGYENSVISASIGTGFEQYRNVMVSLGLSASYDDLQTQSNASASLKKQAGSFNEISGSYGFFWIKEIEFLCQLADQSPHFHNQYHFMQTKNL